MAGAVNIDGTNVPTGVTIVNATEGQVAQVQFNVTSDLATLQAANSTDNTTTFVCKSIYHGNSKVFISSTNSTAVNKTVAVEMCTSLGGQLKSITSYTKNDRIRTELGLRYDDIIFVILLILVFVGIYLTYNIILQLALEHDTITLPYWIINNVNFLPTYLHIFY